MYPFLQARRANPHIDVYFSVECDGDYRYYRGANQITKADWDETTDPLDWWV